MKSIGFFIGFVFFNVHSILAQPPSLKTSVDKNEILIGEQFRYSVEASFPANAFNISWFDIPDSFNHFEIVRRSKIDSAESNGILTCTQTLTLTSFDSGRNTLPSLAVNFDPLVADSTIHLFTDSLIVNVSFSPLDSSKTIHDIKTIIEVKDEIPVWVWIAGAALLILLIAFVIYLIKYFKKRKKPSSIFDSKLSPIDEALQSLDELQKKQLLSAGEIRQFHTRLSEIFKRYLSRKMHKNILNLTSSEVLLSLNDTLLSKVDTSLIASSLRMTDAVKFAKYSPPGFESETAFASTKKVIEQIDKLIFTD